MRAADLDLRELLTFDPDHGGPLHFAGQRALLMDAVALGLLRRSLIDTLGFAGARALLSRFGFAHGWRTAEVLKALPWSSEADWRVAGGRLHTLQGLVSVEPIARPAGDPTAPFAEALWRDSYEAEQHVLHAGRATECVCWTLCGFASGYLSFANGQEIYALEETCVGRGDAICRMVARPPAEWGPRIDSDLAFYRADCLSEGMKKVAAQIKSSERKLRESGQKKPPADEALGARYGIVTRSSEMRQTVDLAQRAGRVDATVLITGPSGVGKERISRLIHAESARAAGPFIAINCAALTESLLESELFGHVKGSFTGATSDRVGLVEAAQGGTLLLDEVGEIPAGIQAKLLRVLQEHEVRRVGDSRTRKVDVRILAATNRVLADEVARGAFRHDLYYRLRVIELRIPPLSERRCDILPLARIFLTEAAERLRRPVTGMESRVADQLARYDWPGNVRELENAIERAVALCLGSRIDVDDLPEEVRRAASPLPATGQSRRIQDVERALILSTLEESGGNRAQAAEVLGIGVATLYRKLKQYGDASPSTSAGLA